MVVDPAAAMDGIEVTCLLQIPFVAVILEWPQNDFGQTTQKQRKSSN